MGWGVGGMDVWWSEDPFRSAGYPNLSSSSFVGPVFGGMMMEYAGFEWSLTVVAGIFLIMVSL